MDTKFDIKLDRAAIITMIFLRLSLKKSTSLSNNDGHLIGKKVVNWRNIDSSVGNESSKRIQK